MAQIPAKLVQNVQLGTTAASEYASPANTKTVIKSAQLTNTTATAATATVYIVPAGGSPGAANTVISGIAIAPGATYNCPELINQVLMPGDSIQALAGTASAISMQAAGIQVI